MHAFAQACQLTMHRKTLVLVIWKKAGVLPAASLHMGEAQGAFGCLGTCQLWQADAGSGSRARHVAGSLAQHSTAQRQARERNIAAASRGCPASCLPSHGCELVAAAIVCKPSRGQQAKRHLLHMHCPARGLHSAIASRRQPAHSISVVLCHSICYSK